MTSKTDEKRPVNDAKNDPFSPEYDPEQDNPFTEGSNYTYYEVDADTLITRARLDTIERRFKQIDAALNDAQLILYGVAIGLSMALILSIFAKIGRIL